MNRKIAVDLDGTLARNYMENGIPYDPSRIGEPIMPMVERVRTWLKAGDEVVIFTARMHPSNGDETVLAERAVRAFCAAQFGRELEVTCMKCPKVDEFYDDKAFRVERDTGRLIGVIEEESTGDAIGDFLR